MNSSIHLLSRLLRLFPVSKLKEVFEPNEKLQTKIIEEILQGNSEIEINAFVKDNIDFTKKSTYIYSIRNKFVHKKPIDSDDLGLQIISQNSQSNVFTLIGYHQTQFDVTIFDDINLKRTIDVKFKQPLKVIINGSYLIIQLTKVETDLKPFFGDDVTIIHSRKTVDDSQAIQSILKYFDDHFKVRPSKADLNKGVKYLWQNDIIDCKELAYRKTASRTKETMDGNELFKNKYPSDYKAIMKNPLESCIFRYLKDDDDLPSHFTCDATNGTISFTLYPKLSNQADNVIIEITKNN